MRPPSTRNFYGAPDFEGGEPVIASRSRRLPVRESILRVRRTTSRNASSIGKTARSSVARVEGMMNGKLEGEAWCWSPAKKLAVSN